MSLEAIIPVASDGARRPPAPGRLELVRQFLNTIDIESGEDDLATPDQLAAWLSERGLLRRGARLDARDLDMAIAYRETLREVLEANAGHPEIAGSRARLDEIAAQVPLRVRIGGRLGLEPIHDSGIDAAIGPLLAIAYEASVEGTWKRLKVCRNDTCRWAFYDSSRNHSGAWCRMAICGNRMKGRAFRQRRSARATAGSPAAG